MMNNKGIEAHYKSLFEKQAEDFRLKNLRNLIMNYVTRGTVLDYGCGTGHLSRSLLNKGYQVTAYDPSQKMLRMTKKYLAKHGHVIPCVRSKEQIKMRFDNIVSLDVLEHIKDDVAELRDMHRMLRPAGRIVISVPAYPQLYCKRDIEVGHYRRYSKDELIKKLTETGFTIRHIRYWNICLLGPYLLQKIANKRLPEKFRYNRTLFAIILEKWFKYVENNINVGIGLSLIVVAERT
jgi:SAM-dependent methyltransferase